MASKLTSFSTARCDISDSMAKTVQAHGAFLPARCYNNSFMLLSSLPREIRAKSTGVIGYVLSSDGTAKMAVRHAWVRAWDSRTGQASLIDVTVFADGYSPLSVLAFEYLPVAEYSLGTWLELTEANGCCPDIWDIPGEEDMVSRLREEGFEVLS